jgi:hypothetical protein
MDYARRSMQRLGFVKWVLRLAWSSRAQTLESLTRAFFAAVTAVETIDEERRELFEEYVRQQHLHRRYREPVVSAEIQDLLLSDPILPSHTGAITGELERKGYRHSVYVEIPTWAARLQLLRERNYTLTDRGRVLLLAGNGQLEKFSEKQESNPLYLNLSERYVSLFCLLDIDGDLLTQMYKRLIELQTFTRSEAGEMATAALQDLRVTRLKNVSAGPMQQVRTKLDRTIEAVKKQSHGGLGPKESIATPRTEPLVDCGILAKPSPDKYEYSFTPWGKAFLTALISADSVSDFLELRLSSAMSSLTGQSVGVAPLLQSFEQPYAQLRAGIGYVSLRELALLVVARALSSPDKELLELNAVEQTLKQAAAQGNRQVRLALGRMGGIAQVRIDQRIFKTV